MSAPSAEHAKAHATLESGAAGAKPAEGGHAKVDGSLAALLSGLKDNIVALAAVPAHVYHEQHHGAAGAGKEGDHPKAAGDHPKADHPKAAGDHPKPDHPKTEGAAPTGDHPKSAGHGHAGEKLGDAAPLFTSIPRAIKAWRAGNLEDRDVEDVLRPLVDLANVSPVLSFMVPRLASGLKSLLGWGLGAHEHVHEIDPVFETLGKQILGFEEKDGTFHHSYEGIVAGMKKEKDVGPMNLHFRHFNHKSVFDNALKGDKPTLQKRIASLLGVEGDLTETEVRNLITTLMHRLGGHGHGTPPHAHITPHQPLRPTLRAKHEALLKLYENAFNWLDEATLDKIFDDKPAEKDFPVDFETFGDVLLVQVTPANRDRYLRPINEQTYKNTFKVKFAYLIAASTLKTAMNKPAEKEKVLAQLRKFLGEEVVPHMDLPAFIDRIKTLRERVSGDPATVPAAPLDGKYNAFIESLKLVEDAFTTADVLGELFGDEKTPEKPIDYANIGQEVLKRTKTAPDLKAFEKQFNEDEMLVPYGPLLTDANMLAEATANPDNLRLLLGKFFAISGTLTNDKINAQAALLIKGLTKLSDSDVPNAHQFARVIEGVQRAVIDNNILIPRLNYGAIGVDVLSRVRTPDDATTLNGAMSMLDVQIAVGSLFDSDTLTQEIEADLPGTQAKIRNLFGITGAVTRASIIQQGNLLETALYDNTTTALPNVNRLLRGIQQARDLLLSDASLSRPVDPIVLAKLYGKEAVEVAPLVINYRQFANEVFTRVNTPADQSRFLLAFSELDFEAAFPIFYPLAAVGKRAKTPDGKTKMKEALDRLFYPLGTAPNKLDVDDVAQQCRLIALKLGGGHVENVQAALLFNKIGNELALAVGPLLAEIYADAPEVTTVKPERLGNILKTEAQTKEEAISFLRGYKPSQVRDFFTVLADGKAFDAIVQGGQSSDLAKLQEKLRAFVGMDLGPITVEYLTQTKDDFEAYLNNAEPATLPADLKAKYDHIVKLLEDVVAALSVGKRLDKLFNPEVGIDYDDFGATVRALPQTAVISFLRELNTGLLATNMMKFKLETTLDTVTTSAEREELRGKLAAFFGAPMDAVLTRGDVEFIARQMLLQFGDPATLQRMDRQAYATYMALSELIGTIVSNISQERLANIYKGAKAKKKVA